MSIVSSTGIGSGIDIQSIVTQLVSNEGQPQFNAIKKQKSSANTRLSGLGTLKSSLSDFQTAVNKLKDSSLFKSHAATSSDESVLKVTASAGSIAGTHAIEVKQLATTGKFVSAQFDVNSASDTIGAGNLEFKSKDTGNTLFSVTLDGSSNSLTAVRDAINNASGNNSVTASIINVDYNDPVKGTVTLPKLVLSAKNTGSANDFTVTASDSDGIDTQGLTRLFTQGQKTDATNAEILVDGEKATRSSNSMTDVLQGLSLDLQTAKPGTTINVNVSLNTDAINQTVSDFVTAYNKLHGTTSALGKYGGSTDGSGSGNGALIGDATLRYISSQIRQDAASQVSSATSNYNSLAMIGIKIDKDGTMSLDSTQLNKALTGNLQSVSDVFTSSNGVASRLSSKLNNFLQSGGPLDSQQTSLQKRLSALDDQQADVQARLDNLQKSLLKQFTAMDTTVGQLKSTGSFLTSWISKL